MSGSSLAAQAGPQPAEKLVLALQTYYQGHVVTARDQLADLVRNLPLEMPPHLRRVFFSSLLDMCKQMSDIACFSEFLPILVKLAPKPVEDLGTSAVAAASRQENKYYGEWALLSALENDVLDSQQKEQLRSGIRGTDMDEFPTATKIYTRKQIVRAWIHHGLGDERRARLAIDRGLSMILSLTNPDEDRLWIAIQIDELISLLIATGDLTHALSFDLIASDFILSSLPTTSFEYALYWHTRAKLYSAVGYADQAKLAAEIALLALASLEIPSGNRDYLSSNLYAIRAFGCINLGDLDCAEEALSKHPGHSTLPDVVSGELSPSSQDYEFILLLVMVNVQRNKSAPVGVQDFLRNPVSTNFRPEARSYNEILRRGALGIILNSQGSNQGVDEFRAMTRAILRLEEGAPAFESQLSLPTLPERAMLALSVLVLTQTGSRDSDTLDLVHAALETLRRTLEVNEGDAFALLATAKSMEERKMIHAFLRLDARQRSAERKALKALASKAGYGTSELGIFKVFLHDAPKRYDLAELAINKIRLGDELRRLSLPTRLPQLAPRLSSLQASLSSREALISVAFIGDQAVHMCVKREEVSTSLTPVDLKQLVMDAKVLMAALTASHAPSRALDRQYPVEAAARLYSTLIAPVTSCLDVGDHLHWLPPPGLAHVPISALLSEVPRRNGAGFDLAGANWLISDFSVSHLSSARQLVASRTMKIKPVSGLSFLGIGDPDLSPSTKDGEEHLAALMRSAVDTQTGPLSALAELPEASVELKEIANHFGSKSKLMLREDATEAGLRREELNRYSYLSFATHGLLRAEVEGLEQAALVLTPGDPSDPFDDGLLTTDEIADLNLSAKLVVLSACNTASFDVDIFIGGVHSLAGAFAVAGVPATLATLWSVNSVVSQRLMSATFANMLGDAKLPPARALASAQREIIRNSGESPQSHPRFWAAFTVFGDQGRTVQPKSTRASGAALEIHPVSLDVGTELLSAGKLDGDQWYANGIGDEEDGVHEWLVLAANKDGEILWRSTTREMGSGRMVMPYRQGVIAAGFELQPTGDVSAILRHLGQSGKLIWEREFERGGMHVHVFAVSLTSDGNLVLALEEIPMSRNDEALRLRFVELSEDGRTLRQAEVELGERYYGFTTASSVNANGRILFFAGSRWVERETLWYQDLFHNSRPCILRARTQVINLDLSNFVVDEVVKLDDVLIADTEVDSEGRVFGVGSRFNECGERSALALYEFSNLANPDELYQHTGPFGSSGNAIIALGDGSMVAAGSVSRVLGVKVEDYKGFPDPELLETKSQVDFDPMTMNDAAIVIFDLSKETADFRVYGVGSDITIRDGFIDDEGIVAVGRVGGRAAWMRIPTRLPN